MSRSLSLLFSSACVLSLCLLAPSSACIHPPQGYEGSLAQSGQTAIVFWDEGVEDLVIRPAYVSKGSAAPASLAWVIPVPNAPQSYGVVEESAFDSLFQAWERNKPATRSSRGEAKSAPNDGIELLQKAVVGEYEIQPIKTAGPGSDKALNAWLTRNGFGAVPSKNMRYYVDRSWVWLCVKAKTQAAKGNLRPLRITFQSSRLVYPLKFSTHQGNFDLTLWLVTRKPLLDLSTLQKTYRLSSQSLRFELPKETQAASKGARLSGPVTVTKVAREQLQGSEIEGWSQDLSFTPDFKQTCADACCSYHDCDTCRLRRCNGR